MGEAATDGGPTNVNQPKNEAPAPAEAGAFAASSDASSGPDAASAPAPREASDSGGDRPAASGSDEPPAPLRELDAAAAAQLSAAEELVGTRLGQLEILELIGAGSAGASARARNLAGEELRVKVAYPKTGKAAALEQERDAFKGYRGHGLLELRELKREPLALLAFSDPGGEDLARRLEASRRLSLNDAIGLLRSLLRTLSSLHGRGLAHGAIAPGAVLIAESGSIGLTDVAAPTVASGYELELISLGSQHRITAEFIAPERLKTGATREADVYAVGAIAFRILAGSGPFTGCADQIRRDQAARPAFDVRAWRPDTPSVLARLVAWCLERKPGDRPTAADALAVLDENESLNAELVRSLPGAYVHFNAGETVNDWVLGEELGVGGMSKVFLATRGDQRAALKLLVTSPNLDDTNVQRFEREIHVMRGIDHPNVVKVLDSGTARFQDQRYPYVALEYVGRDLERRVDKTGPLSPRDAVKVALGVARALEAAHARKVVHRDVKPGNILIRGDKIHERDVCLTDFGVAALTDRKSKLTVTASAIGSPFYMAPEQSRNVELDGRADVYALGATLFYMLTGSRLFATNSFESLLLSHSTELPDLAHERNREVPEELSLIVDWAILKDPEARPESAAALAEELERWLNGGLNGTRQRQLRALVRKGRRPYEKRSAAIPAVLGSLLVAIILLLVVRPFDRKVDPFKSARELTGGLAIEVEGLSGASRPETVRELLGSLDRTREMADSAARESAEAVPPGLVETMDELKGRLVRTALGTVEAELGRVLAEPGEPQNPARLARIDAWLELPLDGAAAAKAEALKSRAATVGRIAALARSIDAAAVKAERKATVEAGKDLESPRAELAKLRVSVAADETLAASVAGEERRLAVLANRIGVDRAALDGRVAGFRKACEAAVKARDTRALGEAQGEVNRFIEALPAGNGEVAEAARRLLILRVELDEAKARQSLARIKRAVADKPKAWATHISELQLHLKNYPPRLFPKLAGEARSLLRSLSSKRNAAAGEALEALAAAQLTRLETSLVTGEDFAAMVEALGAFGTTGELTGWPGRTGAVRRAVAKLESRRQGYGRALLERAVAALATRRPGEGHAPFLKRLDEIDRILAASGDFGGGEVRRQARVVEQLAALRELHSEARIAEITGGTATIGRDDPGFPHNPAHTVKLAGFFADRFEVKVADYARFLEFLDFMTGRELAWCPGGSAKTAHKPASWESQLAKPEQPVRGVNLADARAFAAWAGKRLPTETEWEAAAREGVDKDRAWPWSDGDLTPDRCRYLSGEKPEGPVAVDSLRSGATRSGLLHLLGNVAEWTATPLAPYPGAGRDGLQGLDLKGQVVRGGSFASEDLELAVWNRQSLSAQSKPMHVGFRCVSTP